jgi:arsenite-transporting ATPase
VTRVLLLTGKGGVGKTTIAAATAVHAARAGHRVLLTSTDPAHSLADVLGVPLGDTPRAVEPGLDAQQLDAQARLEAHWSDVRAFLVGMLHAGGLGEVQAEELMLLPGLDELFALIDLQARAASGEHDVIVVDCAPTAETLRLLALPDALRWYIDRIIGPGRGLARAVAPVARAVGGFTMPDENVLGAVDRLQRDLATVHTLLRDRTRTSMRLVTNPERLALDETQRLWTSLSLFGYAVDAVVVNRVLPDVVHDPYLARWKQRHAEHLATARDTFSPLPVLVSHLHEDEPIGPDSLAELAGLLYGELDPTVVLHDAPGPSVETSDEGWVLRLALPLATREDVDVARRGSDLHVRAGGTHRTVPLPARLRRCRVTGAGMHDGVLEVRFADVNPAAAS